jgi:hypothetical protein
MSSENIEFKLELAEDYMTYNDVIKKIEPINKICQAMNEKGLKCSRRQKPNSIYCGKHNNDNDHILDKYIQVSIKMINVITYYVNKCGVVLSYDLEKPKVIGFLKKDVFVKLVDLINKNYSQLYFLILHLSVIVH